MVKIISLLSTIDPSYISVWNYKLFPHIITQTRVFYEVDVSKISRAMGK